MELFIAYTLRIYTHAHTLYGIHLHHAHCFRCHRRRHRFSICLRFSTFFSHRLLFFYANEKVKQNGNEMKRNVTISRICCMLAACLLCHNKKPPPLPLRTAHHTEYTYDIYLHWNAMCCDTLFYFQLSKTMAWPNVFMIRYGYWLKHLNANTQTNKQTNSRALRIMSAICVHRNTKFYLQ